MKRNGKIELLRFIFSIAVLCFHARKYIVSAAIIRKDIHLDFCPNGAMGVEFFFILSGFLMASSVFKAGCQSPLIKSTFTFMKKKFMSIFPMHCLVVVPVFAATAFGRGWSAEKCWSEVLESIPGLFFLQITGTPGTYINHIEWYLSAMLFGMLVIYPLLYRFYKVFSRFIAPGVCGVIIVYLGLFPHRLTGVWSVDGFIFRGFLRAVAELCLGIVCFEICKYLQTLKISKQAKGILTFVEAICWVGVFVIIMLTLPYYWEFIALALITMGTIFAFSGLTYGTEKLNSPVIYYLGKLSLPIYLCQLIPIELTPALFGNLHEYIQEVIVIVATLIISVGLLHLNDLITGPKSKRNKAK